MNERVAADLTHRSPDALLPNNNNRHSSHFCQPTATQKHPQVHHTPNHQASIPPSANFGTLYHPISSSSQLPDTAVPSIQLQSPGSTFAPQAPRSHQQRCPPRQNHSFPHHHRSRTRSSSAESEENSASPYPSAPAVTGTVNEHRERHQYSGNTSTALRNAGPMYPQYQYPFNSNHPTTQFFAKSQQPPHHQSQQLPHSQTHQQPQHSQPVPHSRQQPQSQPSQQQVQLQATGLFRSPGVLATQHNPASTAPGVPGSAPLQHPGPGLVTSASILPNSHVGWTSTTSAYDSPSFFLATPNARKTTPSPQNPLSAINQPPQPQQHQSYYQLPPHSQQQPHHSMSRVGGPESSPHQRAKAEAIAALQRTNGTGSNGVYSYFGRTGMSPTTQTTIIGSASSNAVASSVAEATAVGGGPGLSQAGPAGSTAMSSARGGGALYTHGNHVVNGMASSSTYTNYAAMAKSVAMNMNENLPDYRWAILDLGAMGIKNLSLELFQYTFLTALYLNHNQLSFIPSQISCLTKLAVIDLSRNKLQALPREMGLLTDLTVVLVFDNMLQQLPWEFGSLFKLETMGLDGNYLSEHILSLNQKEGSAAVIQYLRDHSPAMSPPPERDWVITENQPPTNESNETCSVFCFNILCQKYASSKLYGYTPSWALSWDYRRLLILEEILNYTADVVCLQEVEMDAYEKHFRSQMKESGGYESAFAPKSRARTMSEWERKAVDGCATFFRSAKYTLVEQHLVEFNQVALHRSDFPKNDEVFNRLMTKDNIALFTVLESKESRSKLLVANCHIHWDPELRDVKLVQVAMLMEELEKFAVSKPYVTGHQAPDHGSGSSKPKIAFDRSGLNRLPIIICGDFNSTPNSGVYQLLSEGHVDHEHEDFGNFSYGNYTNAEPTTANSTSAVLQSADGDKSERDQQKPDESQQHQIEGQLQSASSTPAGPSHHLNLKSAYSEEHQLPFTNCTPTFRGVIDYIWYTSNNMTVMGLLGEIDAKYSSKIVGLPNAHFPSDHIPILAEFRVRGGSFNNSQNLAKGNHHHQRHHQNHHPQSQQQHPRTHHHRPPHTTPASDARRQSLSRKTLQQSQESRAVASTSAAMATGTDIRSPVAVATAMSGAGSRAATPPLDVSSAWKR